MAHSAAAFPSGKTYLASLPDRAEINFPLLAELVAQAEATAPRFSWEVINRLAALPEAANLHQEQLDILKSALQRWFVSLYQPHLPGSSDAKVQSSQVPLTLLLSNFEIIIRYGREVAGHSLQNQAAMGAFLQSLSHELANRQLGVEQRLQFLSELLVD